METTTFENFVYIIKGINKNKREKYYIGYTNNLYERIRKHNREIKGGAKATQGYTWTYYCIITNIRSKIEGLQLEKRLQICGRKSKGGNKKHINDKINMFLSYVDINNRVSPNGIFLKSKIFLYIDKNLYMNYQLEKQLIIPLNTIIFKLKLDDLLIDHLMSDVSNEKLSKKNQQRQKIENYDFSYLLI
jgi:predicted GIY-YIG superfamily endonuclease